MPMSSKSPALRVANAKSRERAIAAIWQSVGATGRPVAKVVLGVDHIALSASRNGGCMLPCLHGIMGTC